MKEQKMKLKIVVTCKFCHPHFGGISTIVKDFYNFDEAEKYYFETAKDDKSGYSFTEINIVEIAEATGGNK